MQSRSSASSPARGECDVPIPSSCRVSYEMGTDVRTRSSRSADFNHIVFVVGAYRHSTCQQNWNGISRILNCISHQAQTPPTPFPACSNLFLTRASSKDQNPTVPHGLLSTGQYACDLRNRTPAILFTHLVPFLPYFSRHVSSTSKTLT